MKLKDIIWICQLYNEDETFRKEIDSLSDSKDFDAEADAYYSNECIYPFLPLYGTDYMPHVVIKTRMKDGVIDLNQRHCILSQEAKNKIKSRVKSKKPDYEERKKWIEEMEQKYGSDAFFDELTSSPLTNMEV